MFVYIVRDASDLVGRVCDWLLFGGGGSPFVFALQTIF